mgnify:FL=1
MYMHDLYIYRLKLLQTLLDKQCKNWKLAHYSFSSKFLIHYTDMFIQNFGRAFKVLTN